MREEEDAIDSTRQRPAAPQFKLFLCRSMIARMHMRGAMLWAVSGCVLSGYLASSVE